MKNKMKNKMTNLFGNSKIVQNEGVKYSVLLEQFIEPFLKNFDNVEYLEDILEFSINAWNFGNLKEILPDSDKVIKME